MLPKERRKWIENQLADQGKIDIEQLSQQLNVSTMTIRRDLNILEKEGKIFRTHGGAIHPKSLIQETPYSTKKDKNVEQKKVIALKAIEIIPKNSNIILDSGTTTFELAKLIKDRADLTVITNDIKIAAELVESKLKVIVTGGELQNEVGTLYGWPTQDLLRRIHADIFFLGAHAVDVSSGITAPTFEKSLIKKLMMQAAESTWLLCDSSKFNQKSFSFVCHLSELEGIITDQRLLETDRCQYSEHVKLIVG
ncbi:DeoR/GlpR family DNA-binding transcription regulator [Anoxybacillus sp. LAT_38]|uniref:DeoR/GlpR family DNA-binding transcription regulator n=1 Tax=Anoxybacillus sp. LAT_26 TaxID=2862719 RepID=UPI001EEBB7A7|nr:DeoR/GlpR family DNA-binding transcription regulator [Anoxybacillus sp. LAT_26]MCG6184584.1 DeoR/GlpR family DNA-binding transcription regulator [Anoxybacillus sp. LAT_26]MCG6199225.1 DeoR/GlpR family DNA-binding transcription regulator [Anoxybacillus sp. LAT_38]